MRNILIVALALIICASAIAPATAGQISSTDQQTMKGIFDKYYGKAPPDATYLGYQVAPHHEPLPKGCKELKPFKANGMVNIRVWCPPNVHLTQAPKF